MFQRYFLWGYILTAFGLGLTIGIFLPFYAIFINFIVVALGVYLLTKCF